MERQESDNGMSRREFLRRAGVLAGAVALAGCAAPTPEVIEKEVVVEKIVKETVEVEKQVVVEKEVEKVVTAVPRVLAPATLNVWINWSERGLDAIQQISAGFIARHPGMQVEILPSMGGTEGVTKLLASLAAGNPPDLYTGHANDGGMFTSRGAILSQEPYLATSRVKKEDFFEAQLNRYTHEGELYGIPSIEGAAGQALLWNKGMFEEVGLDPEVGPSTLEETREWSDMLEILDSAGNVVRLGLHPRDSRGWSPLDWWFDREWYDPETQKLNITSPNMIYGVDWIVDFYRHVGPEKMVAFRQEYGRSMRANSGFPRKAQAMIVGGYYLCDQLHTLDLDIELGLGWMPTMDGKKVTTMRGWFWLMPVGCPHPDQSWQYIEDFTTVESAFILKSVAGYWPSYKPFLDLADWSESPGMQWMIDSPYQADEIYMAPPLPVSTDEVEDRMDSGMERMMFEGVSAEEMLTEVEAEVQKLIDQAIAALG